VLFWAGNQGSHQNFDPSLLPTLIDFHRGEAKKIQNGQLQKGEFFKTPNSQDFLWKISGIGPWVSRIN
jgi:hypothetical protein